MIAAPIRFILERAQQYEWSIQGLGMLRLYLSPEYRLHIWSRDARRADVSTIHDHPWDFTSLVISGQITNRTYERHFRGTQYMEQRIVCGPGGGIDGLPKPVILRVAKEQSYLPGQQYGQWHDEIHESIPTDGTVTLIRRRMLADTEHAHVFFRDQWVSAEPRLAAPEEVALIVGEALERWKPA